MVRAFQFKGICVFTQPTIADFKAYFNRDFPYGATIDKVMDSDIQKGMDLATINLNVGLFCTQQQYTIGFLLLSAHYLVLDLRASSQGIAGNYPWLTTSKSVGSVSEGLAIPPRILDNPIFAMLTKTNYGAQYLDMVLPQITGQMFTVHGRTLP